MTIAAELIPDILAALTELGSPATYTFRTVAKNDVLGSAATTDTPATVRCTPLLSDKRSLNRQSALNFERGYVIVEKLARDPVQEIDKITVNGSVFSIWNIEAYTINTDVVALRLDLER